MGQVKDSYRYQMQAEDDFADRCFCLLYLMIGDFIASPLFFDESMDHKMIKYWQSLSFFESVEGINHTIWMCLAMSLIFH